jgi:hypothetical protein
MARQPLGATIPALQLTVRFARTYNPPHFSLHAFHNCRQRFALRNVGRQTIARLGAFARSVRQLFVWQGRRSDLVVQT